MYTYRVLYSILDFEIKLGTCNSFLVLRPWELFLGLVGPAVLAVGLFSGFPFCPVNK